jgi:hypothetical protein
VRRIKVSVLANGPARSAGDRGDNLSENQKKITQGIRTRCRFFAKAPLVGAFLLGDRRAAAVRQRYRMDSNPE